MKATLENIDKLTGYEAREAEQTIDRLCDSLWTKETTAKVNKSVNKRALFSKYDNE